MNSEFPADETAPTPSPAPLPSRRPNLPGLPILILLLLAFAGGIAATLWAAPAIRNLWQPASGNPAAAENAAGMDVADQEATKAIPNARNTQNSQNVATLEARLAALSAKLDAISEQAAGAGGNAARAEGLLIAFAARRALDRGSPLGYLEGELRLRFGDAQPRAVATIINAAHTPITLADLQAGLDEVTPALLGTDGKTDWWTAAKREFANLVIIRKADSPSPVPQKTVERSRVLLSAGRVDAALREIERLPNHEMADNWVQMARQYNEARRALDVIEAAAILEPRSIPVTPRAGGPTNMQVAPPPPEVPAESAPTVN